jgi:hypothetical protein
MATDFACTVAHAETALAYPKLLRILGVSDSESASRDLLSRYRATVRGARMVGYASQARKAPNARTHACWSYPLRCWRLTASAIASQHSSLVS